MGNAVVGAWLKVYAAKEVAEETDKNGKPLAKQPKKEWWETAPRQLEFTPSTNLDKIKTNRKADDIYHFLLPDKNMSPSAGIKMLKEEYSEEAKRVTEWKKDWCKPLKRAEVDRLKTISKRIDELLAEYYRFQRTINIQTASKQNIFGGTRSIEQGLLTLRNYDDKERLADQRNRSSAPYFKLKMVMDYWCSLWFWDVRQAGELPGRNQYWQDIEQLLEMDVAKNYALTQKAGQQSLFDTAVQTTLAFGAEPEQLAYTNEDMVNTLIGYTERKDLFDKNERLEQVKQLAAQYHFFHPQLEFLEVFWERGGFDLIAGNPPWLKLQFEEKTIIAEKFPEVVIRSVTAPQVRIMQSQFFADARLADMYLEEIIGTECTSVFMNAGQNYPLLVGQQTNLYKCVLENGFNLLSKNGFMGLLHPEGVYDDPNGQLLRGEIYPRLKYHFQYTNELSLFAEVHHNTVYGTQVYSGSKTNVSFFSISGLFHPSTIDGSFIPSQGGVAGGIKIKDLNSDKFVWNIKPHSDRVVHFRENELNILAKAFENSSQWETAKLVSVHSSSVISVLRKLSEFESSIQNLETKIREGWHETNDVDLGIIKRSTEFPQIDNYEMIYSGPHFFVSNPLYKTPTEICKLNSDYDIIDANQMSEEFISRTNYVPDKNPNIFSNLIKGFKVGVQSGIDKYDKWIDYYKIGFRKMLSQAGERTLTSAILPPKTSHIHGVISLVFREQKQLIEAQAICSSIVLDFFIKTVGA